MANAKKVALITGANKGLGFEMARQLGQAGVTVVLASRDPKKGEAAAEKLRKDGLDVQFLKLDVTHQGRPRGCRRVSRTAVRAAGYSDQQRWHFCGEFGQRNE